MTRLGQTIGACTLACILFQTAGIHAATYYVATTGSNSHPGTQEQPWRTVAHAVNTMVAGDTTYVRGGQYDEGRVVFGRSGTQAAPIKLLNYPNEAPIIRCINPGGNSDRVIIYNNAGKNVPTGWITIEGFEITHCAHGIDMSSSHDITVRRNWIHDNAGGQGILASGLRIVIDRNVINHNGRFAECAVNVSFCNKDHGIYGNGLNWTITNNLIYDNLSYGIQIAGAYAFNAAEYASQEYVNSANWIIANNTIAYNNHRAAIVVWGPTCDNLRIENNIMYENGVSLAAGDLQGIDFVSGSGISGMMIRNNLSYASGSGATVFLDTALTEGVHYTQSGNIVNTVDPAFVNASATPPASPNFALTNRSPAIDKGLHLPAITTAFNNTPRPQGRAYDIGAYEYKAGGDGSPPAAPIALQAR